MTRLTFLPTRLLCCIFFFGVGGGEQIGADLRIYISVVPPPHCGIDVALWGRGGEEVDEDGEAKRMS